MGRAGREHVMKNFTIEKIVAETGDIFLRIIENCYRIRGGNNVLLQ